ncbi:hypothetical protein GGR58DRAFT_519688 [Xylaria digitata]|nr:hypothetical protein GGR58DRAFT_519688 [Xylaria digitata]
MAIPRDEWKFSITGLADVYISLERIYLDEDDSDDDLDGDESHRFIDVLDLVVREPDGNDLDQENDDRQDKSMGNGIEKEDSKNGDGSIKEVSADPNPAKVVKAFLVGTCIVGISPIFAEAATKDNGALPPMDDSLDGLRFVGRDGQEHARYISVMTTCYAGAMTEIKKYLYDVDVTWAPKGVDKSQLTRDRARKGPVEEALDNFLRSNSAGPSMAIALGIA